MLSRTRGALNLTYKVAKENNLNGHTQELPKKQDIWTILITHIALTKDPGSIPSTYMMV